MIPQKRQMRAMTLQVQPKPIRAGRLARRIGQTTDPRDEPVLMRPLIGQNGDPMRDQEHWYVQSDTSSVVEPLSQDTHRANETTDQLNFLTPDPWTYSRLLPHAIKVA
jgi:hypothetical protein